MINETRAAEFGSEIIEDTTAHTFTRKVIAIKALEDTVIASITSPTDRTGTTGIDYYDGATLYAGETISAVVSTLQLTSGAVQAFYAA